jgi:hypothetical protein
MLDTKLNHRRSYGSMADMHDISCEPRGSIWFRNYCE